MDFEEIKEDIRCIKEYTSDLFKLTSSHQIPMGLQRLLLDSFQCKICKQVIKPPVITTKCCKLILSCGDCLSTWYSGPDALTKSCLYCRAMLKGLS